MMLSNLISYLKARFSRDCKYCVHSDKDKCLKIVRYVDLQAFMTFKPNSDATESVPYNKARNNDCKGWFFKRKKV